MDFHSVMETFAEAWVAANTHTPLMEAAEQGSQRQPRHPNGMAMYPCHSGLINGPTNSGPQNGQVNQGSFAPGVLQESSNERQEADTSSDNGYQGRQSPIDTQHNCTVIGELRPPLKNLSNPHGMTKVKCIPIHCIVEQIPGPQACGQYVELDSYAIIPGDTLFNELVRTALVKLGYSDKQILGAKGSIQIKNWKPLSFDQITDNPQAVLVDILGDLTTVATLHIRLYSVPDSLQEWTDTTVRNAVLELLREMSQSKLSKLCPLSQPMLSNIINNKYMGKIGKEKCQEFGKWYLNYRKQHPEGNTPQIVPCNRPLDGRLTFHPTKELPVMREWFQSCRNPSRRTLQMYVDILNQGPVRQQERPKVAYVTLKNWWKNEKQRERKHKTEGPENKKRRGRKPAVKQDQREDDCDGNLQEIEVTHVSSEPRNLCLSDKSSSTAALSFVSEHSNISQESESSPHKADYVVLQVPEHNKTSTVLNTVPSSVLHNSAMFQKLSGHCEGHKIYPSISERFFMESANHRVYCPKINGKDFSKHGGQICSDHIVVDV